MNDTTIIQIVRTIAGAALLGLSVALSRDGLLVATSLVLMGVPFEAVTAKITAAKAEKSKTA